MKTINPKIANTLPDQLNNKFTKNVLKKFKNQINTAIPHLTVKNTQGKEIGEVEQGDIVDGCLKIIAKVNPDLIDKQWEYYFVPDGHIKKKEIQGQYNVITSAIILGVNMVKFPTDLTLKPVRFEQKYIEGVDYHIKEYEDLTPGIVAGLIKDNKIVFVYYPHIMGVDEAIQDSLERVLVTKENGELFPFNITVWPKDFEHYKKHIKSLWKKESMEGTENPLKNLTKMVSLN